MISTFGFAPSSVLASTVKSYWQTSLGVAKFAQKSYYPAYQEFLKALEEDPLSPELQMNLARTFEVNEEFEKAEKAYKGALKFIPEKDPLRFQALFNLAGALGKQSKIEEALVNYQAALELQPESQEVKTNIELLWQQGGGGGKGENKDKNKDEKGKDKQQPKDGEGKDKDQKQNPDQSDQKEPKKQPKPFQSQELTPQDVKKILDEIKNQEQAIRANEYEHNAKEAPRGKDW